MNTPDLPAPCANAAAPLPERRAWFALLARVVLGAIFLAMGAAKAGDPVGFLKLVREYQVVVSAPWLNLIAVVLPWFEIFCGFLLLFGVGVRGAAVLSMGMLVPFTTMVVLRTLAIREATGVAFCAIRFDCGCGAGEVLICSKLVENALLIALALGIAWAGPSPGCLRFALFPGRPASRST